MSLKSIVASWVIAMCLLGLVSLLSQPAKTEGTHQQHLFILPEDQAPETEAQVTELEAKVWCAMDSNQTVQFKYRGQMRKVEGSMGIQPQWVPTHNDDESNRLLISCENVRHQQLANLNAPGGQPNDPDAALDFMFTTL